MRGDDFSCFIKDLFVLLILGAIVWLMTSCSSSKKVVSDRETRDSVVYIYKTHYRDSLRVKDSTVIVYETVQRDSVVLRVDKATGEVLSKDSWHWKDTNRNRDHISNVRNKVEKSDSVALTNKSSVVVSKTKNTANLPQKAHYTQILFVIIYLGVVFSVAYRYRKG